MPFSNKEENAEDFSFDDKGNSSLTMILEDKGEEGATTEDVKEGTSGDDIDLEELMNVDLSEASEEVQQAYSRLADEFKGMQSKLHTEAEKAEFMKTVVGNLRQFSPAHQAPAPVKKEGTSLADQFKFEDNDYYAKFLTPLAQAVDGIKAQLDTIAQGVVANKGDTLKQSVMSYFQGKNIPVKVIAKMDEIAGQFGPSAYSNLPRLHKFALTELGLPTKIEKVTTPIKKTEPTADEIRKRRTASIPRKGIQSNDKGEKKVSSMTEAFDKAVDELSKKETENES